MWVESGLVRLRSGRGKAPFNVRVPVDGALRRLGFEVGKVVAEVRRCGQQQGWCGVGADHGCSACRRTHRTACGSRAPRQKIVWSWGGASSGRHAELGVKHVLSKFTFLRVDFRKAELYAQSSGHLYLQAVLPTERLPFFIGSVAVLCPVTSQPPPLPQPCRRRRLGRTAMPNYRPQSAAVSGTTRTNTIRPQSAPLPKATQPKLVSRAELDEISQKMFDRAAAYAARRDKLHDDHVEKINGWKLRVEIRPAVYGGKERFKYMSEASKSALAEACWLPLNHPR